MRGRAKGVKVVRDEDGGGKGGVERRRDSDRY